MVFPTFFKSEFGNKEFMIWAQRQRGRLATARAGRQGVVTISAPEPASSTKLWAGSQLLTTDSWDPGWLTSARRVAAWDQLSRGDTRHTRETKWPGLGKWLKCTVHLGQCAHQTLGCLSCSDLGRTQNACPTHRDWARTVSECLLWWYGSSVACHRGSGCSRPGYDISPLGGDCD